MKDELLGQEDCGQLRQDGGRMQSTTKAVGHPPVNIFLLQFLNIYFNICKSI